MRTWRVGLLALLAVSALSLAGPLRAQVIDVDFDTTDGGVQLLDNAVIQDDGCGNQVLMLTQNVGGQRGYGWFPAEFNLNDNRVEIEFDLLIGASDVTADANDAANGCTPADGVSVIFQFSQDLAARGDAGGGMGVGCFRDASCVSPSDYISVGFDIWNNGGVDPATSCDGRHGGASSCHVEVDQNIDPEVTPSQATNVDLGVDCPDYISSAALYGTPETVAGTCGFAFGPQSCDEDDLIHVTIIFDNQLMLVKMEQGVAGDGVSAYPETTVLDYATQPFPDTVSNIGFTASTGSRYAWQWVDNIVVRESPSAVTIEKEPVYTSGAITCGGPADVDATGEIGFNFLADRTFGTELSRTGDIETGLTVTTNRFGRTTLNNVTNNIRDIDVSQIPGAGPATAEVFAYNRWDNGPIVYRAEVEPGQYDVTLYFAEDYSGSVTGLGYGTKLIDVTINGEAALCYWSAASAAGSPTGSGDPFQPCTAVLDTGIARTFSVSVEDAGEGFGVLDIQLLDLGNTNPPENVTVNGVSFNRTGDATGSPISGDVECLSLPAAQAPGGVLIDEDFEDAEIGLCPPDMTCNAFNANYTPQVVEDLTTADLRLRLSEDLVGDTGTTAIFEQTVNIGEYSFQAEFDVYMAWGDDQAPADGGSFFVLQGTNTTAVGAAGGAMGIPAGTGFTVEFDTWLGGGNNEPSGYNDAVNPFTHVGINDMSTNSIITNVQYDPDLVPVTYGGTGWPDFRQPGGVHVEVLYDTGTIQVYLEGTEEDGVTQFPRTLVAETSAFPFPGGDWVVGFSGANGGANQTLEFDNVVITAEPGGDTSTAEAVDLARQRWADDGELYINCGGPLYACANQFPSPGATGDADKGDQVVWLQDQGAGAAPWVGEFFTVTPLNNFDGSANTLNTAGSDMGAWDAKGTDPGIDANDRLFWSERYADCQYDIPVPNGQHEVTLYFANSHSGTAGTALRFWHVIVEGETKGGFNHCEFSGNQPLGGPQPNPVFGYDELFDPVDAAEQVFSSDPCNFATCTSNGVTYTGDPDGDQIPADQECGNAAPAALRYTATVTDGALTIAITDPDTGAGEPASPDGNPKISAIAVKLGTTGGPQFARGDADANGGPANITDGIYVLNFLFLGGPPPPCRDAADGDDNGEVNITDGIYILNFLFLGGPPPPDPAAPNCGTDTTPSALTCDSFPPCE